MDSHGTSEYEGDKLLDREQAQILFQAFHALPLETRAVLWLYCVERESIDEIAELLEIPPTTVSRLLHWGLETLVASLSTRRFGDPERVGLERLLRELPTPAPSPKFFEHLSALWRQRRRAPDERYDQV